MNHTALITRLDRFARVLPPLVQHLPDEDAKFKPPSGAWSILEIVCHLGDEEVEDFRTRLQMTLEDPEKDWPKIDPEGIAKSRRYNEQDLTKALDRFVRERAASIDWLRALKNPNWDRAYIHPKFGPQTAGMLLASWAAHDALHLRQIAKRLYELAARDGAPHTTGYAGEWGA
jgi:hypothetical protein